MKEKPVNLNIKLFAVICVKKSLKYTDTFIYVIRIFHVCQARQAKNFYKIQTFLNKKTTLIDSIEIAESISVVFCFKPINFEKIPCHLLRSRESGRKE